MRQIPTPLPPASTSRSYTRLCVDVRGLFTAEMEHRGELHCLLTHVVRKNGQSNLLGRNWIRKLPDRVSYIHHVNKKPCHGTRGVKTPDCFRLATATQLHRPKCTLRVKGRCSAQILPPTSSPLRIGPEGESTAENGHHRTSRTIMDAYTEMWSSPVQLAKRS